MKNIRILSLLGACTLLSTGTTIAEETLAQQPAAPIASEAVNNQAPIDVSGDAGIQAVQAAQVSPQKAVFKPGISAESLLSKLAQKEHFSVGTMDDKGRLVVMGIAEQNMEDPTIDPDAFLKNREVLVQRALLDARAQIAEFMNSTLSAEIQSVTPGTDLNAEFGERMEEAQRRLDDQKKKLTELLKDVDKAQAESLAGVTVPDRMKAMMDAAIKKLDASYNKTNIERGKAERLATIKQRYQESLKEYEQTSEEIRKRAGTLRLSYGNKIQKLARMPIFGSTCIYQTESYDKTNEKYQVAVLIIWSIGLEKATRAIVAGEPLVLDAQKRNITVEDWINSQDLSCLIGPRTFMDEKGQRYFLGISARAVVSQASLNTKNRNLAALSADATCILSLHSDMEVSKQAELQSQTRSTADNKEETQTLESLQEKITASIKDQNVNGLGRLFEGEVTHGLTGIKMHVVVSGISPEAALKARNAEEINYAAAIRANKYNSYLHGRKDQLEASKNASVNDSASYNQGRTDAADSMTARTQPSQPAPKPETVKSEKSKQLEETLNGATGNGQRPKDEF